MVNSMGADRHMPAMRRAADGAARDLAAGPGIIQALVQMRCRACRGRVEAAILDNNLPGWCGCGGRGSYG